MIDGSCDRQPNKVTAACLVGGNAPPIDAQPSSPGDRNITPVHAESDTDFGLDFAWRLTFGER